MSADLTARLDAIEAAHAAATAGPWQVDGDGDDLAVTAGTARGLPGSWMATDRIFTSEVGDWSGETEDEADQRRADAAAIVAAHNNVAWLVAAVRGVLDRHHRISEGEPGSEVDYCEDDGFVWPCATYQDITAALGEAS